MPNHVTHRIVVTGPEADLKKFREDIIVQEEDKHTKKMFDLFDFNRIIPMPEALRESESSSLVTLGLLAWHDIHEGGFGPSTWQEMIQWYQWIPKDITTREELQAFLLKQQPGVKDAGDKAKRFIEQYGHVSWYEWAIEKWGTKWGAYEFRWESETKDRLEFLFDTAWSPPVPVFKEVAKMFPTLTLEVASFDEGHNFACRGEFHGAEESYGEVPVTAQIYKYVYGEPLENDEDDDDEEGDDEPEPEPKTGAEADQSPGPS